MLKGHGRYRRDMVDSAKSSSIEIDGVFGACYT